MAETLRSNSRVALLDNLFLFDTFMTEICPPHPLSSADQCGHESWELDDAEERQLWMSSPPPLDPSCDASKLRYSWSSSTMSVSPPTTQASPTSPPPGPLAAWGSNSPSSTSTLQTKSQKLSDAVLDGNCELLRTLLLQGANTEEVADESMGYRPLHMATTWRHLEAISLLLGAGADPHASDHLGNTPLHLAAAQGLLRETQLLQDAGADPLAPNAEGSTAIHLASAGGHGAVIQALLRHKGGTNTCPGAARSGSGPDPGAGAGGAGGDNDADGWEHGWDGTPRPPPTL
ncbi:unnamed protein product [Discosporangium mesarthrocarpum]